MQHSVKSTACGCVSLKATAGAKCVPGLLCRSPALLTTSLHTGSTQKYLLPYHRWPASERVHSSAPRQPAKATNTDASLPALHEYYMGDIVTKKNYLNEFDFKIKCRLKEIRFKTKTVAEEDDDVTRTKTPPHCYVLAG